MTVLWQLPPDKLRPDGKGGFRWAWQERTKEQDISTGTEKTPLSKDDEIEMKRDSTMPPAVRAKKLLVRGKSGTVKSRVLKPSAVTIGSNLPPTRAHTAPEQSVASPSNVEDSARYFGSPGRKKAVGGNSDRLPSAFDRSGGLSRLNRSGSLSVAGPGRLG
eukprot:CAMPEP_0196722746 /NCGR_PEP_ID=MMETSP1091-20130531/5019_1 /TAXON_ID=302021 /ORGANISM="Rhodomonas sp., Strain CCMP768" /LENGTH=160 /DNA_ID=CAMNT_0042064513 /DNA_START=136 /DNA_END=615 /DNA_ORIENTATION=-